jgi:Fe-S cluster biosynthesis and repair protein YggX
MPPITCTRCRETRESQAFSPFPNELGQRLLRDICGVCWAEWLKYQQQLINHYALNLRDSKARQYLLEEMEKFLSTSAPQA